MKHEKLCTYLMIIRINMKLLYMITQLKITYLRKIWK
nr:MAG TPA: hypothetical protein [Caudoviricetes sp.]